MTDSGWMMICRMTPGSDLDAVARMRTGYLCRDRHKVLLQRDIALQYLYNMAASPHAASSHGLGTGRSGSVMALG